MLKMVNKHLVLLNLDGQIYCLLIAIISLA